MDRKDPKALAGGYQERRRSAALDRQREARREVADRARRLAMGAESEGSEDASATADVEIEEAETASGGGAGDAAAAAAAAAQRARHLAAQRQRYRYREQLQLPEWMVEVPPDLGSDWFVAARPEGRRCLLVAARGSTTARLRTGALLDRFPSALPGGGPSSRGPDSFSILDCIFHEPDQTYYVQGG